MNIVPTTIAQEAHGRNGSDKARRIKYNKRKKTCPHREQLSLKDVQKRRGRNGEPL
ncbi:hypothetical protein HMPREF1153_0937 [Selenomonas sp. CM52]|nr:hypothetical protein HMPREF1153_0937 [Selenomonas sp. CM52]